MNPPSAETSIGKQLKAAREKKGWTVQEAARRTKVKTDLLEKLEADEFELLPSMAYARGFIRIYARELGLDGWSLLRQFDGEVEESIDMLELQTEDFSSIPKRTQPPVASSQGFGLFIILGILILAGTIGVLKLRQVLPAIEASKGNATEVARQEASPAIEPKLPSNEPPKAKPVDGAAPVTPKAEVVEQEAPRAEPVAAEAPQAQPEDGSTPRAEVVSTEAAPAAQPVAAVAGSHRLQLKADLNAPDAERWVRVVGLRGGQEITFYENLLPPGQPLPGSPAEAWVADAFIVTMREASAVEIIFNGQNFGRYEYPGVQRIRLPPEQQ